MSPWCHEGHFLVVTRLISLVNVTSISETRAGDELVAIDNGVTFLGEVPCIFKILLQQYNTARNTGRVNGAGQKNVFSRRIFYQRLAISNLWLCNFCLVGRK